MRGVSCEGDAGKEDAGASGEVQLQDFFVYIEVYVGDHTISRDLVDRSGTGFFACHSGYDHRV